jgi:hypothetical protein
VQPIVSAIDTQGNDVALVVANPGVAAARLDNQSPNPPTTFQIPNRQVGWISGTYVFTGVAGSPTSTSGNYTSGGDAGVSDVVGISTTTGNNGQTTFTYFFMPAATYLADKINIELSPTTGTSTGATNCATTGFTQVSTGNDIPESSTNLQYVVRVLETDKLGNIRCTDLGTVAGGVFTVARFGVDKTPPTAVWVEPGTDPSFPNTVGANAQIGINYIAAVGGLPSFRVAVQDPAPLGGSSGFGALPLVTKVTRLAINNAANGTGLPSTPTDANGFGCPVGFNFNNGACQTAGTPATFAADVGTAATGASSGIDGYYTVTTNAIDLARNQSVTLTRTDVVDRVAPAAQGIGIPPTLTGGTSASFPASATDNLDLVGVNYTLAYPTTPSTSTTTAPLNIRATGDNIGVAFDNTLTTARLFNLTIPFFIRSVSTTTAGGVPQNNPVAPTQISLRVTDAANNVSAPSSSTISAANVPQTNPTNYAAPQTNTAVFQSFGVLRAPANISNCQDTGCIGGAAPANATTVTLAAQAQGNESATFQFLNPFTQVQFYYLDPTTTEWTLIGSTSSAFVTDNATVTQRTYTWTLAPWDPPASAGTGALNVIAVGVNASGDALASAVNSNVTLTNP